MVFLLTEEIMLVFNEQLLKGNRMWKRFSRGRVNKKRMVAFVTIDWL